MNIEPRPSEDCGMCQESKECPCSCHTLGNVFNGYHYNFNAIPNSMVGITDKIIEDQVIKRNGLH